MKASTLNELKQELVNLSVPQLTAFCLKLARFKKENKELLTYLLFEAHDEAAYVQSVKKEMIEQFENINDGNIYFAKKSIRKILRTTNKYIRYSGSKTVETELLICYCSLLKKSAIPFRKSAALVNLYERQVAKISKAINAMHEDLQHDYLKEIKQLNLG
ncbi:MAG: hypothetical protein JST47_12095 [Bacteroidetes bacterium]|nr:hypothetical protein [Bacteroidota bacterium]MBS1973542.1 hypothetical protein [Bacteroidota bacterium]